MTASARLPTVTLAFCVLVARLPAADHATDGKLRIVVFGAHPDDAQYKAGDIGHWRSAGGPLTERKHLLDV